MSGVILHGIYIVPTIFNVYKRVIIFITRSYSSAAWCNRISYIQVRGVKAGAYTHGVR